MSAKKKSVKKVGRIDWDSVWMKLEKSCDRMGIFPPVPAIERRIQKLVEAQLEAK